MRRNHYAVIAFASLVAIGIWIAGAILIPRLYPVVTADGDPVPYPTDPGMFGDMLGSIGALFSGLSFVGIVIALIVQTIELKAHRESQDDMLSALKQFSSVQLQSIDSLRFLVSAQTRESRILGLKAMIDLLNERITTAQRRMPTSWTVGSPDHERRVSLEAEIAALVARRNEVQSEIQDLDNGPNA